MLMTYVYIPNRFQTENETFVSTLSYLWKTPYIKTKLKLEKCAFMVRQGKILEHIVSKNGISTNKEKVNAIAQMAKPTYAK